MALIDQPLGDRLAGELGPADRDVRWRALLQALDRRGVELALESGSVAGHRPKCPRVDDLVRRAPGLGKSPGHLGLVVVEYPLSRARGAAVGGT